ncbi:YeeE/YedE family protein [Pedobacter punctiformis]|uniref:YeeE/YedE thiosulfate transporter family protein n=1 Tax=Pedobacter punctiformis TaxID=3004097 RepID=A0ABT4L7F9_9SPHI|nr:YeeE/YedE thiosulfate transporter family protein [Pedobacter sp. HCMS5-2]MCZ4243862.1 YeeE/YedE thiosulfate transporter family protein [Pedobacter sp. HCMS5-2]
MNFLDWIKQPWPWYVAGPLIGLIVPGLLLLGNKPFGISANLRHICAACIPAKIPFFQYDWKKESWNLFFVLGILLGAYLTSLWLSNPDELKLNSKLVNELSGYGIHDFSKLVPSEMINWTNLLSLKGFILIVFGGFMVGFGTRYAGGCTSGHAIMGISSLQWPSLIATICFMVGGFFTANLILPYILKL